MSRRTGRRDRRKVGVGGASLQVSGRAKVGGGEEIQEE
jgi:hypothetical protein